MRTFSRQSFASSYYLKQPRLLAPVAAGLVAGSAHRQLARSLHCAPSTITRLAARLGRLALLLQAQALEQLSKTLDETVVWDHFETFVFSQDDRLAIGTAVGQDSWFVYTIDPAPHGRTSPRAARRRPRRLPLPEPVPNSFGVSTRRLLDLLRNLAACPIRLVSDDHPAYRQAAGDDPGVVHRAFANPTPRAGNLVSERDRQLFAVDLLHKLIRHSQAHHRRETIAFGRRSNALLERAALLMVWRNFVKQRSEREAASGTPAMRRRLVPRPWSWGDVLARRRFPERIRLPAGWRKIYTRGWITPAAGRNRPHDLHHAF